MSNAPVATPSMTAAPVTSPSMTTTHRVTTPTVAQATPVAPLSAARRTRHRSVDNGRTASDLCPRDDRTPLPRLSGRRPTRPLSR
ncbi:hypothetical protein JHN59_39750, partial [Streptomyces sp. MBT49]|uniref:hypothetical protein n=1 Tax=Streptomyces sp. MBT49 TaxID=1488380 RepID=UPI00190BDF04